jgi:hypothetical protein
LSKSIGKNLNPLPEYAIGKESSAKFSFSKDERFKEQKSSDIPGPNVYFYEKEEHYNIYRLDNLTYLNFIFLFYNFPILFFHVFILFLSQGTSIRFKDFEFDTIPGPGYYKIKGFSDETIEKATKFKNISNSPNKQNNMSDSIIKKFDAGGNIEENKNENK